MPYSKIGKILGIDPKTAKKATEDAMSEEVPNSTEFGQSQNNNIKLWIPKSRIYGIRLRNNIFEIYVKESVAG